MSAFGRVWRRAPAWRLCLITAIAFSALCAMFPPQIPGLGNWHGGPRAGTATATPPAPPGTPSAHFAPAPDTPPIDGASVEVPHASVDRSGIIPFAGRQILLPAGQWKDVLIARLGGAVPGQIQVLGRIEHGELTGLLQANAPSPGAGAAGPLAIPSACYADNAIAHEITPELPSQSPLAHECWVLIDSDMTAPANRAKIDDVMRRALVRLDELGARIPDHMLLLLYIRSSETGWLRTLLMLPADKDVTTAANRRIEAWCRRFVAALHAGYDGKIVAALPRDPT
jgi:hypothetical protein